VFFLQLNAIELAVAEMIEKGIKQGYWQAVDDSQASMTSIEAS